MCTPSDPLQETKGWLIKDLWEKYEDIAMHFNDLIIRLRTQALAAVAALSALVGVFGNSKDVNSTNSMSWELAAGVFLFLGAFWVAIWLIDFLYYNRLLTGAVLSILALEEKSKTETRILHIDLSKHIEDAVSNNGDLRFFTTKYWSLNIGRWLFYGIVFLVLVCGLVIPPEISVS